MLEVAIQMFEMHHKARNELQLKHSLALSCMKVENAIIFNSLIEKQERECFELLSYHDDDRLTLICIAEYSKIQTLIEKENSFDQEKMILSSLEESIN